MVVAHKRRPSPTSGVSARASSCCEHNHALSLTSRCCPSAREANGLLHRSADSRRVRDHALEPEPPGACLAASVLLARDEAHLQLR